MTENKTRPTDADVRAFLDTITDERRRRDAELLVALMGEVSGESAVMWGPSIIGFGSRHYRYDSGREGDIAAVSFSPRKTHTVLYLTGGLEAVADLLPRLGPHKTGKACLYLKRVDAADPEALREAVVRSLRAAESATQ